MMIDHSVSGDGVFVFGDLPPPPTGPGSGIQEGPELPPDYQGHTSEEITALAKEHDRTLLEQATAALNAWTSSGQSKPSGQTTAPVTVAKSGSWLTESWDFGGLKFPKWSVLGLAGLAGLVLISSRRG